MDPGVIQRGGTANNVVGLLILHVLVQEALDLALVLQLVHVGEVHHPGDHGIITVLVPQSPPGMIEILSDNLGAVLAR